MLNSVKRDIAGQLFVKDTSRQAEVVSSLHSKLENLNQICCVLVMLSVVSCHC